MLEQILTIVLIAVMGSFLVPVVILYLAGTGVMPPAYITLFGRHWVAKLAARFANRRRCAASSDLSQRTVASHVTVWLRFPLRLIISVFLGKRRGTFRTF